METRLLTLLWNIDYEFKIFFNHVFKNTSKQLVLSRFPPVSFSYLRNVHAGIPNITFVGNSLVTKTVRCCMTSCDAKVPSSAEIMAESWVFNLKSWEHKVDKKGHDKFSSICLRKQFLGILGKIKQAYSCKMRAHGFKKPPLMLGP